MNYQLVRVSRNAKTGKIPVTNSPRTTCPDSCPLKAGGGCYAEAGYYTKLNWNKLDAGERGTGWDDFISGVYRLPDGQLWRHNVSGDLPHTDGYIDEDKLRALVTANHGKHGFTYTHHDMSLGDNYRLVKWANEQGFVVNLSANNIDHAYELRDKYPGIPVVTLLPANMMDNPTEDVVVCPAVTRDDVTCKTCKLCSRADRPIVIGFPSHGSAAREADDVFYNPL